MTGRRRWNGLLLNVIVIFLFLGPIIFATVILRLLVCFMIGSDFPGMPGICLGFVTIIQFMLFLDLFHGRWWGRRRDRHTPGRGGRKISSRRRQT